RRRRGMAGAAAVTGGREDVTRALVDWDGFPPGTPAVITVVDHDGTRRDVSALRTATGGWAWVKGDGTEPFHGVGVHADAYHLSPRSLSDERLAQAEATAWEAGVRQAITWLRADYPYGTGPDWR